MTRSRPASIDLRVPPVAWIVRVLKRSLSFEMALFLHPADLEHLAAEPDHHHAAHVGIGGVAPLGARQHVEAFALARHAAAGAVDEGDDAVDVGIVVEHARLLDLARDVARHRRRAIHRGEDAEIVARARLAAGATEALEGRLAFDRQDRRGPSVLAEAVVAVEMADGAIVLVHPLARRDRRRGEADDLAELAHRLADRDRRGGELVAPGNALDRDRRADRRVAGTDFVDGDHHVVLRMQAKGARRAHGIHSPCWPVRPKSARVARVRTTRIAQSSP